MQNLLYPGRVVADVTSLSNYPSSTILFIRWEKNASCGFVFIFVWEGNCADSYTYRISLWQKHQAVIIENFNSTCSYPDGPVYTDNILLEPMMDQIYPTVLQLNKAPFRIWINIKWYNFFINYDKRVNGDIFRASSISAFRCVSVSSHVNDVKGDLATFLLFSLWLSVRNWQSWI